MADNVYDVQHYHKLPGQYQVWDLILKAGLGRDAALANVLKYVLRFADKNGLEDLKKAEVYLAELIRIEEGGIASKITNNYDEHMNPDLAGSSLYSRVADVVDSEEMGEQDSTISSYTPDQRTRR